ncbi:recombinase family protein [Jatrophihabitans sp. DSM 45814]
MVGTSRRKGQTDIRPWAIYARLSAAKPVRSSGRRRAVDESVGRQQREIRAYAAEHGLPISEAHVFVDNHLSAWKRKGAIRPDWQRLMAVARAGEVQGVLIWKLDRFTRAPRDMEDLIDLAELHSVGIDGPNSGYIDLTTAAGRQQARGAAAQAAAESDNTSERSRAALADLARAGYPLAGGRAFGFEVLGEMAEEDIPAGATTVQRPAEVVLIREAASRMLAGEALRTVAADWGSRGIVSARGKPFTPANLGRMLGRKKYGGRVEWHGEVVGRIPGEPILDEATYEAVQTMLISRRRGRKPNGKYELSGLVHCGRCGHTMAGATATATRSKSTVNRLYRCPPSGGGCGLAIKAETVETQVRARALELLTDPDIRAGIGARDAALDDARSIAAAELAAVEAELVSLEVKAATGELIRAAYDAAKPILDRRRVRVLAAVEDAGQPSRHELPLVTAKTWDHAGDTERRQYVTRLGMVITVGLANATVRNRPDVSRVVITP